MRLALPTPLLPAAFLTMAMNDVTEKKLPASLLSDPPSAIRIGHIWGHGEWHHPYDRPAIEMMINCFNAKHGAGTLDRNNGFQMNTHKASKRSLYLFSVAIGVLMWFVTLSLAYLERSVPLDTGLMPLTERLFSSPAGIIATCGATTLILWGGVSFITSNR